MKLLNLIRERRKYETRTLDGYKPTHELTGYWFEKLMHHLVSEEIEIEMKTIGGQNKTKLRKEAKGNPYIMEK